MLPTLSTLLPCCSRPYSFPRAVTLSTSFTSFRRSAIARSPFFSLPSPSPLPHFCRCSPTALPAGFIREAKCARDSYSSRKRASEREREKERGKGTLFLGRGNENCAGPTSASAHLLARKGCNGRRRWTKKLGEKKRGEPLRGKRESAASRNNPMSKKMARRHNWIHSVSLIYFCRMTPSRAAVYNPYATDNAPSFYL